MGSMFHDDGDGLDFDRWHDDGGLTYEERQMIPDGDLPENFDEDMPYDGEPADIDDDRGYDPYAGGPEMDDCISDDGPFSDFGSDY